MYCFFKIQRELARINIQVININAGQISLIEPILIS